MPLDTNETSHKAVDDASRVAADNTRAAAEIHAAPRAPDPRAIPEQIGSRSEPRPITETGGRPETVQQGEAAAPEQTRNSTPEARSSSGRATDQDAAHTPRGKRDGEDFQERSDESSPPDGAVGFSSAPNGAVGFSSAPNGAVGFSKQPEGAVNFGGEPDGAQTELRHPGHDQSNSTHLNGSRRGTSPRESDPQAGEDGPKPFEPAQTEGEPPTNEVAGASGQAEMSASEGEIGGESTANQLAESAAEESDFESETVAEESEARGTPPTPPADTDPISPTAPGAEDAEFGERSGGRSDSPSLNPPADNQAVSPGQSATEPTEVATERDFRNTDSLSEEPSKRSAYENQDQRSAERRKVPVEEYLKDTRESLDESTNRRPTGYQHKVRAQFARLDNGRKSEVQTFMQIKETTEEGAKWRSTRQIHDSNLSRVRTLDAPPGSPESRDAYAALSESGDNLGLATSDYVVKERFPNSELVATVDMGNESTTSGRFDRIYRITREDGSVGLLVVEAKSYSAGLGYKKQDHLGNGLKSREEGLGTTDAEITPGRMQQGTIEYYRSTSKESRYRNLELTDNNGNELDLMAELQEARYEGNLDYWVIRPLKSDDSSVFKAQIKEFSLPPWQERFLEEVNRFPDRE